MRAGEAIKDLDKKMRFNGRVQNWGAFRRWQLRNPDEALRIQNRWIEENKKGAKRAAK